MKNLDIESQNLDIESQNLDIESQNLDIEGVEVKINTIDSVEIINKSNLSNSVKNILIKIYDSFFNKIFSRGDIVDALNISNASGTNYINYLLDLNVIEPVSGQGKGKYKFR